MSSSKKFCRDLQFIELEKRQGTEVFIPGGGFTKVFYEKCLQKDLPVVILLAFASEGNNAQDGLGLAQYFNTWSKMVQDLKVPPSWIEMYGAAPPTEIYN